MYTTKKIHSGFVGALLLLAALVLFSFHTRPAQRDLAQLQAQINVLRDELQTLEDQSNGSSTIAGLSEVDQRELADKIPETIEQDFIITELNRISKATSISFNVLSFNLQQNAPMPTITISGGFQGTPENVGRFLKMLENDRRKFVIKDAGVSRMQTESGLNLVNLNITIQAFYRQDE